MVEIPSQLKTFVKINDRGFLDNSLSKIEWVDLRKIHSSDRFQCRDLIGDSGESSGTDDGHVSSIVDQIQDKPLDPDVFGSEDELPLLIPSGNKYDIVSGFHRVEALRRLKFDKAPVRIYQVPEADVDKTEGSSDSDSQDILEASLRFISLVENTHKGSPMKLGKRDRLKTLRKMLENPVYQDMSSLQLSKMTGISDKTVSKLRKELGIKSETVHTSDGKERSSSRKSGPRAESRVETLARENEQLRRELRQYKTAYERLKVEVGKLEGGVELLKMMIRILTESEDDSVVESSSQVEDGTIIDVEVREVQPERLQLDSPAPRDKPWKSEVFDKVSRLIDDWTGEAGSESLNQLTGRNWSTYKRKMTPDQVKTLEDKARDKGLRVDKQGRPSKS